MKNILLTLALLASVTSCKIIKEKTGMVTAGPDEYQVQRGKSLEIPPHFDLPLPSQHDMSIREINHNAQNLNESERAVIQEINKK